MRSAGLLIRRGCPCSRVRLGFCLAGGGASVRLVARTLRVLAEADKRLDAGRLDELISSARRQADLLEEFRVRAAG